MEQNTNTGVPITPVIDNKQKNGNGLKITTAIACAVAVFGIGFGVYGMIQSSQKDSQISDLKVQIKGEDGTITTIETPEIETTDENGTTVTIADSVITPKSYGFMADNFATHFEDAMISKRTENFGAEFSLVSDGSVFITIRSDACRYFGDVCNDGSYRSEITSLIPGRVVDFSINTYGNEGDGFVFFVLDDGTVASLSEFSAAKNEQATIVDGSKNIFRLFGGFAQDTSGKIYQISPVDSTLKQFKINQ
ncbi:hypothetical protein IKE97_01905 [Candidatus Saccharibacteria bacterium]|nr:hypothetical protein [Candidatus Saccharibacteria bacterium]